MKTRYDVVESAPAHRGKNEYLKYLSGERLTMKQQILAKCYDCMGYYADGATDCELFTCSLYPMMPYRKEGVSKARVMTPESKAKLIERFKKGREAKKEAK
jgi:hypothetical protein